MTPDDAEEYTASLGQIVSGSWRQIALAKRLGVPKALGLSTRQWVDERLGGYVKLGIAERREAVTELLEEGHSQREVADVLGVDVATVNRDARPPVADATDELPLAAEEPPSDVADATPLDMVAALRADEALRRQAEEPQPHVSQNSGENEWYTPANLIEAARDVMGGIDVDPASSLAAQTTVQAGRFFTVEDDGLAQDWPGTVWLNPPYAQPLVGQFVDQLIGQLDAGMTSQAVTLTNNGTETRWGAALLQRASAVCFPVGRIRFLDPEGNPSGAPLQGQMVTYHGANVFGFLSRFRSYGPVMLRG